MKVVIDNQHRSGVGGQSVGSSYWRKRNDKVITMDIKRPGGQNFSPHKSTTGGNVFVSQTNESMLTPNRNKSPSQYPHPSDQKRASISSFNPLENTDCDSIRKENQRLRELCKRQQDTIAHLEDELAKANDREVSYGRSLNEANRKVSIVEDELIQFQKTTKYLEQEIDGKKKELSERDKEKSMLQDSIKEREKKIKELETKEQEIKKETEDLKNDQEEKKKRISEIETEKKRLVNRIEEHEITSKKIQHQNAEDREKLEKEIRDLKEKLFQIEKANQEKDFILTKMCSQILDLNKTRNQVENSSHSH